MIPSSLKIIFIKVYWLAYSILTSCFDYILFKINYPIDINDNVKQGHGKLVIYLGEQLPPRIPRIAKWVKRVDKNLVTVLLCHRRGFHKKFVNENIDALYLFRNQYHLRRILKQLPDIYLIHAFAPKSYFPSIALQSTKHPFILDMQDVYVSYYGLNPDLPWLQKELPNEKACFERADGIVAHSLELLIGIRKYEIEKRPKTIFFPLYCDNDSFISNNKSLDSEDMHFVYAGGVAGSHRNKKQYGAIQFHGLIEELSRQKIHFHVYPSPSSLKPDYEEYEQIAAKNVYFHLHDPINQSQLSKELSKYHFGVVPFFMEDSGQGTEKFKYATALKLFNYMEAGIPSIVSRDLFYQSWLVRRYSCGIAINKDEIHDIRKTIFAMGYHELLKGLEEGREQLSLQRNINRLIDFYTLVVKTHVND